MEVGDNPLQNDQIQWLISLVNVGLPAGRGPGVGAEHLPVPAFSLPSEAPAARASPVAFLANHIQDAGPRATTTPLQWCFH